MGGGRLWSFQSRRARPAYLSPTRTEPAPRSIRALRPTGRLDARDGWRPSGSDAFPYSLPYPQAVRWLVNGARSVAPGDGILAATAAAPYPATRLTASFFRPRWSSPRGVAGATQSIRGSGLRGAGPSWRNPTPGGR